MSARDNTMSVRASLWFMAVVCGVVGCLAVFTPVDADGIWRHLADVPYTIATALWGLALIFGGAAQFITSRLTDDGASTLPTPAEPPVRWRFFFAGLPYIFAAVLLQNGEQFSLPGVIGWGGAVVFIVGMFVRRPLAGVVSAARAVGRVMLDDPLFVLGLAAILAVGLAGRLYGIADTPPELNHDHVEKLLDTQRIVEGKFPIFLSNNGGREPLHFYLLALLSHATGGVNRTTLHVGAILESVLSIGALVGLGTAVHGGDPRRARRFGLLAGLLGATGYWSLMVARVGLRIALTPLFSALVLWLLVRLLRSNRRSDAVLAGLMLGVAAYGYQALRVLPLLAVMACVIGLLWRVRPFAERRRYVGHLGVMALCAIAVALPLLYYAVQYPDVFWSRVRSNVVGPCQIDPNMPCVTPDSVARDLSANIRNTALMFTYRGDPQWSYNAPYYPALDPLAGAFFLAGFGSVIVAAVRRRDGVAGLVIGAFVVLLLPTVLSIGQPWETPSSNRASGALPPTMLFVAFGMASLADAVFGLRRWHLRVAVVAGIPAAGAVMLVYALLVISGPFTVFYSENEVSTREVGAYIRGELNSGSPWGNVYMVHGTYTVFSGPAALLETGATLGQFPLVEVPLRDLPVQMYRNWISREGDALDVQRDLVFIYSRKDETITPQLKTWFPTGTAYEIPNWIGPFKHDEFTVFRVPPLGEAALIQFLRTTVDESALQQ